MKQKDANYEVLLFTHTRFSKKQFCEKNNNQVDNAGSGQLQNACWNGLVFEILPDMIKPSELKNPVYTWNVIAAENFIEIKIGAFPYSVEGADSLNPHLFFPERNLN